MTDNELVKKMLLVLAQEHKSKCNGECTISLAYLRMHMEETGMKFTEKEKAIFI